MDRLHIRRDPVITVPPSYGDAHVSASVQYSPGLDCAGESQREGGPFHRAV